jgi:hypothetical protein
MSYNWRGRWAVETSYLYNEGVLYEGKKYVAIYPEDLGIPWNIYPSDTAYWRLIEEPAPPLTPQKSKKEKHVCNKEWGCILIHRKFKKPRRR